MLHYHNEHLEEKQNHNQIEFHTEYLMNHLARYIELLCYSEMLNQHLR